MNPLLAHRTVQGGRRRLWAVVVALALSGAGALGAAVCGSAARSAHAPFAARASTLVYAPLPAYNGVPVLNYHGVLSAGATGEAVTSTQFAEQTAMLAAAHFHAITVAQYVAWLRGSGALPSRPVLITFDDGRLDSWRGVEPALNRYHLHAVMFAIAAKPGSERFFLSWAQLREMAASRRWDIQFHADYGHVRIPVDRRGDLGPWYANESPGETFAHYERRVRADVASGLAKLRAEIPGFEPLAMALPYGSYGQCATDDARIPAFLGPWLASQFPAVFTGNPEQFTTRRMKRYQLGRLIVTSGLTAPRMYSWLKSLASPDAKPAPVCAAGTGSGGSPGE